MGTLHRSVPMQVDSIKNNDLSGKHIPVNAASFSSVRTMVAYRDGQLYMDTKRQVAYVQDKHKVPDLGTANRK